jgi:GT2 family glycosyltransferase
VFFQENIFENCVEKAAINYLVSPKILYSEPDDIIWYAGGHVSNFTALAKIYGGNKKDSEKYNKSKLVKFAPGCFLFVHKSIFEKIGFFDESFFVYFEDADFCLRCNKLGYNVFYLAENTIYHKVSFSSGGAHSQLYVKLMAEGRLYFIYKNFYGISFITAILTAFMIIAFRFVTYDKVRRQLLIKGSIKSFRKILQLRKQVPLKGLHF